MRRIGSLAVAVLLVAASAAAQADRHRPRPSIVHGHSINAWGGSHHLKLR